VTASASVNISDSIHGIGNRDGIMGIGIGDGVDIHYPRHRLTA